MGGAILMFDLNLTGKWRSKKYAQPLFAKGFKPPDHLAIVIKFAQSRNNSKTFIICVWPACVPCFPLWQIMLTFLLVPRVEFWVAMPSSLHPLLSKCRQISLSNIGSSYVWNKSNQTSKGRNKEGCCMRRLQPAFSTSPVLGLSGEFDYYF